MAYAVPARLTQLAMISLTATSLVTSIHHVYRLGLEVLVPAIAITALPYVIMRWYRSSGSRTALWSYAGLTAVIFAWFGFVDGFLDHVLKVLGLQNTTFLPGGEQEMVPTVFSLWSPEAGYVFYEGTGVLTFFLGVVAVYYTHRVLLAARTARMGEVQVAAPA